MRQDDDQGGSVGFRRRDRLAQGRVRDAEAGGERSQTLAALKVFIPMMKERGYRFTTVTEGLNLSIAEQQRDAAVAVRCGPPPRRPVSGSHLRTR